MRKLSHLGCAPLRLDGVRFTAADIVGLDDLVISSGWIEPPF